MSADFTMAGARRAVRVPEPKFHVPLSEIQAAVLHRLGDVPG